MQKEYGFTKFIKNPYAKRLKKQVTIRLETETVDYFKRLSSETDIPYQKLINMFLRDCAQKELKPNVKWLKAVRS